MKLSITVLMGLLGAAASATAAPILYDINFTTTSGVAPTAGSFLYDSVTETFSGFIVDWNGVTLDLTASANSPNVGGVCDVGAAGGTGFDSFSYLSNPTCGSGNFEAGWSALSAPLLSQFAFSRNDNASIDRIFFNGAAAGTSTFVRGAGSFAIAPAAVPEPSTIGLMFSGGLLLAWRRKQRPAQKHPTVAAQQ
jgi:hypothetical protein